MSGLWMPARTLWIDTASGSRYRIDPHAREWARESHDPRSDGVRTPGGPLLGLAAPPRPGLPAVIVGPGLDDPRLDRVITTTPVVGVHTSRPKAPHSPADWWWGD